MSTRREFMAATLAAALTQKAGTAADSPGEWRNRQAGLAYRRLGRTGFMISEVVMGGNTISPDNYEHVLLAADMGLNYLDTAPAYGGGRSESGFARVLSARKRDQFFLNTKVSPWDINRSRLYKDIFDSLPESDQKKLRGEANEEITRRQALDPDYFCGYFRGQQEELEGAALADVMSKHYGRKIDRNRNYRQLILDSVDQSLTRLGRTTWIF